MKANGRVDGWSMLGAIGRRIARFRLFAGVACAAIALEATPAVAHPHVFVDAKAILVFDAHGDLIAIRHSWTFDEVFSAWQTLGLDANGDGVTSSDELAGLAKSMMTDLAQYRFFTLAGGERP